MTYNKFNKGLIYSCVAQGYHVNEFVLYVDVLDTVPFITMLSSQVHHKLNDNYCIELSPTYTKTFQYDNITTISNIKQLLTDICLHCHLSKYLVDDGTCYNSANNNLMDILFAYMIILKSLQANDIIVTDKLHDIYSMSKGTFKLNDAELLKFDNQFRLAIVKSPDKYVPNIELLNYI